MIRQIFTDFVSVSPNKRETLTHLHTKPWDRTADLKQVSNILQKNDQPTVNITPLEHTTGEKNKCLAFYKQKQDQQQVNIQSSKMMTR